MSVPWLAKIKLPHGTIFLMPDWRWLPAKGSDDATRVAASLANLIAASYEYSPADGRPGGMHAGDVAKHLGGSVTLPPETPADPNALY